MRTVGVVNFFFAHGSLAATWARPVGNSWRTTGDIEDRWDSIMSILDQQVPITQYAGPGGWNDPDMLEVGNGGCTYNEYVAHFSLWALLKSPLLIGCDVVNIKNETLSILLNTEVIAVNQDVLGISGARVYKDGNQEIWAGPLARGPYVAVLLNRGETATTINAPFQTISSKFPSNSAIVRDLWKHQTLGVFKNAFSATVAPHSVVMIKLTPN